MAFLAAFARARRAHILRPSRGGAALLAALLAGCTSSSDHDNPGGGAGSAAVPANTNAGSAGASLETHATGVAGSSVGTDPPAAADADARWLKYSRGDEYPRLEFEVDTVAGLEPRDAASAPVLAALGRSIDKPGGIALRSDGQLEARGQDHVWSFDELAALADATFEDRSDGGRISIHLMFVDGHYQDDSDQSSVLGLAWDHRHIALFKDNIARSCNARSTLGLLDAAAGQRAEAAVWLHEVGHVLGLVDNGLPMVTNHRDPDPAHGRHDADQHCVMYWAYDGEAAVDAVLSNLISRDQLDYCQTNLDDLAAVK